MMFVITRLFAVVAVCAGLLAAAACSRTPAEATDVVSDVDIARAAVLSGDPVLKNAQSAPVVMPGRFRSTQLGWDRTEVDARLYQQHTGPDGVDPTPAEVERQLSALLAQLRATGWSVHWAMCLPNSDVQGDLASLPLEVPLYQGWEEVVMINKLQGGVSYWGMMVATIVDKSGGEIDMVMRAPNARDSANLFPTAPPKLAPSDSCAEDGHESTALQTSGVPLVVKDWYPFPSQSKSPDPHRL
jgi:hypothetical protein